MMRLDRDNYVDIDFQAIEKYEIAKTGSVKNTTKNQYLRCDEHKIGKTRGCRKIGEFDGDSILIDVHTNIDGTRFGKWTNRGQKFHVVYFKSISACSL